MKRSFRIIGLIIALFVFLQKTIVIAQNVAILNGLSHEFNINLNSKLKNFIQIHNSSNSNQTIKIYQKDYKFSSSGESWYMIPLSINRSNSTWLTIDKNLVSIEPNEEFNLNYEIKIPQDSSLSGSYWSVIMIESITSPDTIEAKKGLTIKTSIRYAIQIITHIGETGTRELSFLNVDLLKDQENPELHIDIENTGERALRPRVSLELFSNENISLGVFTTDPKRIYPGCSARFKIALEAIKPGKYKGVLVADCEEDHVFGSNVEIEI